MSTLLSLGSAYGEIQIGTGEARQNVAGLADQLRNVGTKMSLAISAPLAIIGKQGLQAAMSFETSLNTIQAVSGATAEAMSQISAKALQLGADTAFSAGEAAEGMLELAKAGFNAEESMAAIGGVLDLAAAGSLSVAQAAEITANALNAFNLPASEASRVADLLAAAANSSSIEVSDMAQSFQMSSSVFASNKQSIEDLSTAIALLGNNGIKGSDAGTSLKTMMMRLAAPTNEASAALAALNVEIYNADGSMRAFEDIVKDLSTASSGLSDAQRNTAFNTIFGADAIRAASILVSEGATSWDAMEASVTKAGAAQEVAQSKLKGLSGAIEYAKGTLESTLISAFLPFLDTIGNFVRGLADLVNQFSLLPEPVRNAAVVFGAVLAAAGPLLVALPMLAGVIGALVSPIGLVVIASAGLAAAWVADWGGIQAKTEAVINSLQPALARLQEYLTMIKGGDWGGLQKAVFADVSAVLQQASATIQAFNWSDWISGALDWAQYIGPLVWDGFLTVVDWQLYIWRLEWDVFISVLDWANGIVSAIDWSAYITKLQDWSAAVGTVAWDSFISALTWTSDIVGAVDWSLYIARLTDWSAAVGTVAWDSFISTLTWTADIVGAVDWAAYIPPINWADVVTTLGDWGSYVSALAWSEFVSTLSDWGQWIAALDWKQIITTMVDWATWIPALPWNAFVKLLDWTTIIAVFVWREWITQLEWGKFIEAMGSWEQWIYDLDWSKFVATLSDWGEWISGALDWAAFILPFAWDSFVSKLEWPIIAEFAWNEWIVDFQWPTLPSFSWSSWIARFNWPTLPSFNWRDFIPTFSWPSIPSFPGWGAILGGGGGGGQFATPGDSPPNGLNPSAPPFAIGTAFAPGGVALVGERGPEMVMMPRGAEVLTNGQTNRAMAAAGGGDLYLTVGPNTINDKLDVEQLIWRIEQAVRAR